MLKANDVIRYKPTGETLIVLGVAHTQKNVWKVLIADGTYERIIDAKDCELLQGNDKWTPQAHEDVQALLDKGLSAFVDVVSAIYYGYI